MCTKPQPSVAEDFVPDRELGDGCAKRFDLSSELGP
jgi:hypothetical protein